MGELGQLGLGEDVMERKKATPVGGVLKGKKILQVVCGGIHTVALLDGGEVRARKENVLCSLDFWNVDSC